MTVQTGLTLEQVATHLASIAGPEHTHPSDACVTVAPADAEQAAAILRLADANGLVVAPCGNGTKQGWGNPVAPAIRLSLARMNALREHAWQDMTCTVQAGCTWAAMQAGLARHGQRVALDPLWPQRATVGGIVATNDSGALRLRYGSLRDLIIGMTLVLADGTIARSGGKVVKNVAGYDLHKLLTGSLGTLGVITEVNFRLHPIETHARNWTVLAPDPACLAEPLRALMDTQLTPSAVQLRVQARQCALDIRIAAVPACLEEHATQLGQLFSAFPLSEADDTVWLARQELFQSDEALVLKLGMLPSEVCAVAEEVSWWAGKNATYMEAVAQANGLMTVALKAAPDAALALVEQLRTRVARGGGSVVAQQVPKALRRQLDVWGCTLNALPLMREIKRRFDPNRILNPGCFAGGI